MQYHSTQGKRPYNGPLALLNCTTLWLFESSTLSTLFTGEIQPQWLLSFFFEPSKHDPISKPFCRYLFPLPRILIPHTTAWLSTSPSSNLCSNLSFQWHLPWWPYSKSHPSLPPELSSALYCSIFLYGTLHLHTYYVVYWILCISTFCLIPLEHKLLVSRGFCLFHVPRA